MKIELPAQKTLVHEATLPIRWGDMDAMGHVNNASYFRYMETVRIDWLMSIGFQANPAGEGPVIANAFCNFYRQFEYPGTILIKLYLSDAGRSSVDTWLTMEKADQPGDICAAGGATMVWVNFPQQRSIALPDWVREMVNR
ncbi:acyl-CoA thioesterase [Ottowia sp.]|uniref:acyl-CoA thioesterase n=1 Tax=Ottowia sp. TaxID=1898956 RepID=UPI003A846DA4